jgi:hypothetical protein
MICLTNCPKKGPFQQSTLLEGLKPWLNVTFNWSPQPS